MTREKPYAEFNLFILADRAIMPTSADTPSRFTISIEPVQVFDYRDRQALTAAIEQSISVGIPVVADPPEDELEQFADGMPGFKNPPVLKYAGITSWDELERRSICFSVQCYPSGFLVDCWGRAQNGKWSEEQSLDLRLPSTIGVTGLVDAILEHLKTRKDLPGLMMDFSQQRTA